MPVEPNPARSDRAAQLVMTAHPELLPVDPVVSEAAEGSNVWVHAELPLVGVAGAATKPYSKTVILPEAGL